MLEIFAFEVEYMGSFPICLNARTVHQLDVSPHSKTIIVGLFQSTIALSIVHIQIFDYCTLKYLCILCL